MNTLDPAVTSASAAVTIDDLTDAATVGAGIDLAYHDAMTLQSLPLRARRVIVRLGAVMVVFYTSNLRVRTHTKVRARMLDALGPAGGTRAWSMTGPYGAGKSAFVVLLTQLLRRPMGESLALLRAVGGGGLERALRHARDGERPFAIAPVTATYGPLVPMLLDAFESALHGRRSGAAERLRGEVDDLRRSRGGVSVHRRILRALDELAACVGSGLVIVLDELGKTLEHAARASTQGRTDDVFLLQELAEYAARSGSSPVLLVTLLHQSFDRYAAHAGTQTRAEWAKVQGRFEDVAFLDAPPELLRVAAKTLRRRASFPSALAARYDALAVEAVSLGIASPELLPTLRALAPLHPLTALVLPTLFRGPLAQNERSLFDLLTSQAPHSVGHFVAHTDAAGAPTYTLDRLYDYLTASLGPARFGGREGRRWAALDDALARLGDGAPPASTAVAKVVGILSLLGSRTLRASEPTLRFALAAEHGGDAVAAALQALSKASLVVYRRHRDAWVLWEGSDIDLDATFEEARRTAPAIDELASMLRERAVLRPRVARRHFIETGTLRYFDVTFATPDPAALARHENESAPDGRLVYLLPAGEESTHDLVQWARRTATAPDVVIGVPHEAPALMAVARDWHAWDAVRTRVPELAGDAVARRELATRLRMASTELEQALQSCFGVGDDVSVSWVRRGEVLPWRGARGVTGGLSAVCDDTFCDGPRLRNELLNRQALSSSAAAARRALLDAMLTAGDRPDLDLEGAPPEWSMYASLLREGGIHREREGVWGFGPPPDHDPLRLRPTWNAIEFFLDGSAGGPRPLRALFQQLACAPIGLREGPAPVMFFAVLLAHAGEVALFEDGTFVAELSSAVVERLLRRIDHFTVVRYRIDEARAQMMESVRGALGVEAGRPVDLVRAVVRRVTAMPRYTRATRRVGPLGLAFRETVLAARDPLQLLFVDLPRALGVDALAPEGDAAEVAAQRATAYGAALRAALGELDRAYPALLASVEALLSKALEIPGDGEAFRASLTARARRWMPLAVDLKLRAFLGRALVDRASHAEWVEGVAMVVGNRPPTEWSDAELSRFELGVDEVAAMVRRTEQLASPAALSAPALAPDEVARVDDAEREILKLLESRLGARRETWLAALGRTLNRVMDARGTQEETP